MAFGLDLPDPSSIGTDLQSQVNALTGGITSSLLNIGGPGAGTVSMPPTPLLQRTWITYDVKNWASVFRYYLRVFDPENPTNNAKGLSEFMGMTGGNYFFDVPPDSISVDTPFAISLVATNKGVLEEHNGVVFSTITISGRTGVLPSRDTVVSAGGSGGGGALTNIVSQLFPSTISAIGSVVSAAQSVAQDISGTSNANPLAYPGNDVPAAMYNKTGYAKAGELKNFITGYSEIKKYDTQGTLRLSFGSPKDNVEYIASPVSFRLSKDSANPLSYRYEIVLKSWAVQTPGANYTKPQTVTLPTPANANIISQIVSTLADARNVITAATNVIQGVKTDITSVMQIYSQALLLVKSAGGFVQDLTDFPAFFSNNLSGLAPPFAAAISAAWAAGQAATGITPPPSIGYASQPAAENAAPQTVSVDSTGATSLSQLAAAPNGIGGQSPPVSQSFVASQQQALLTATLATPSIATTVSPYAANLPASLAQSLQAAVTAAMSTSPDTVRALVTQLQATSDNLAQSIGQMDATYAQVHGLPAPAAGRQATEQDIITMAALQDSVSGFTSLLSSGQIYQEAQPDPFVSANTDLQAADQMPSALSWYAGTVLMGDDLEALAARYLGDFSRWRELAVLNGLRAPYIDEQGFNVAVVTAQGSTVVVGDVSELYIGQSVRVTGAAGNQGAPRRIQNIVPLGANYSLTLSGTPNLSTQAGMSLFARLPGCVGAGDPIMIPTGVQPDQANPPDRDTPLQDTMSIAEQAFKVDIQLDPVTSDFVVVNGGDFGLSYGYGNAAQALNLKVTVEQGELEWAPSFGLPIKVGGRNSDVDPGAAQSAISAQVASDPRFTLSSATVQRAGSVVNVNVIAAGRQGTALIPVTFQVGLSGS